MNNKVKIYQASFGEAFSNLCDTVEQLGFDGVIYSFYPKTLHKSPEIQPILQYSDRFAPFVRHYIEQDYGNRDFVIRLAFKGHKRCIDWWEEINNGNVRPDELEVTIDARDNFGIQNGMTIPILRGPYAIAGISVITFNPSQPYFEQLKSEKLDELINSASDYHFALMTGDDGIYAFVSNVIACLSEPQKLVLQHLLRNQPMKAITVWNPEISVKNAERILRTIKKELGDISTNQLMYLLGRMDAKKYLTVKVST